MLARRGVPDGRLDAQRQCPIAPRATKRSVVHGHAAQRSGQYLHRWISYACEQGRPEYDVSLCGKAFCRRIAALLLYGAGRLNRGRSHRACLGLRWVSLRHGQYQLTRFSGDCRGITAHLYRRRSKSAPTAEPPTGVTTRRARHTAQSPGQA